MRTLSAELVARGGAPLANELSRRRGFNEKMGSFLNMGIPLEAAAAEARASVTPETAKKLKALGHRVRVQRGAGGAASATDEAYTAVGAEITDAAGAFGCELVPPMSPATRW